MKSWNLWSLLTWVVIFTAPITLWAALPDIPENPEKAQIWKLKRLATIKEAQTDPAVKIPKLYEMLRQLKTLGYRSCDERDEVINFIETTLRSTPDHARFYQEKIEAMRAEVIANSKKSEEEINSLRDEGIVVLSEWSYERYCVNSFRTLAQLPSPESVAVLGFYLNDPVGRDGKTLLGGPRSTPSDDFLPRPINAEGAAIAIRKLGIEHPPFSPYDDRGIWSVRAGEVDAWKDWWNEVKAGKRTYRFIGSNIEYGPDGPAGKEANERATMNQKRDDERVAGKRSANPSNEKDASANIPTKPSSIVGILAVCALIAGAIWYFMRGRRAV